MLPRSVQAWAGLGFLALCVILHPGCSPSSHEPEVTELPLVLASPLQKELRSGEIHEYRLPLESGQVIDARVEQQGTDILLLLLDSERKIVFEVDSPTATDRPEQLFAVAGASGTYRLRIWAAEETESGSYALRVEAPRAASVRDQARARAFSEFVRGEDLRRVGTQESRRQALLAYQSALQLWKDDPDFELTVLTRVASVHRDSGDLPAALDAYQRALPLAMNASVRVPLLNNLAIVHARLGNVRQALEIGEQSLELSRTTNPLLHGSALNNLGVIHRQWGENEKAAEFFRQALVEYRSLKPGLDQAMTLSNLGELQVAIGNPGPALDFLKEALRMRQDLGAVRDQAESHRVLGVAYGQLGSSVLAREHLAKAWELARANGNRWAEVQALNDLGSHFLNVGDLVHAEESFSRSGRIAKEIENLNGEAYALAGVARVRLARGDASGAAGLFMRSEHLFTQLGDPNGLASVLYGRALAERSRGRIDESLASINRALDLVEDLREDVRQRDLRASVIGARSDFYDLRVDLLIRLYEREPEKGHAATAFQASDSRRSRSLLEGVQAMGGGVLRNVPPEILSHQGALRNRLHQLTGEKLMAESGALSGERGLSQIERDIRSTLAEWEKLAEEVRRQNPAYAALTEPEILSVREVQALLDADTAMIAYTVGAERSFLWWIGKESLAVEILPGRATLNPLTVHVVELISQRPQMKLRRQEARGLKDLGDALLGPVAGRLDEVRQIVVVGDGVLQLLPFGVLTRPGSSAPLAETHAVIQLPSASLAAVLRSRQERRTTAPHGLAMFADPVFGTNDPRYLQILKARGEKKPLPLPRELPSLPYSKEEADRILALVPAEDSRRFVGFDANRRKALDGTLSKSQYIHFAAHGLVDQRNPNLSGVQLSRIDSQGKLIEGDGLLPFYEVYNLSLSADLVTLSACQTAVGPQVKGEGPLGMTRSFLYAGASRVVGALWDVDDEATAELMSLFYRHLLKEGKSPAMALHEAQNEMRAQERWRSPYYWGGFVLQGDWR